MIHAYIHVFCFTVDGSWIYNVYSILQLTEVGELGRRGGRVQRPVAVEDDPAHEFATTQNRLMAG